VPTYLAARAAAGYAVPVVEVVSPQSQQQQAREEEETREASGQRKAAGEGGASGGSQAEEEEIHAVLAYVVQGLNEELVTELMGGFWTEK
jgi:hypothetical protein